MIKLTKCSFTKERIAYLGHIISKEGMAVEPEKIKSIKVWAQLRHIKGLRGLLGITGYYKKFTRNYGLIARPLNNLLKKNTFHWDEKATDAFNKLKHCLMKPHILCMPNFNKEYITECDASVVEIGVVQTQEGRPIAYLSQELNGKNLLLSTYEKELLALLLATKKCSQYLIGRRFIIKTDRQSLTSSQNCMNLTTRLNIGREKKILWLMHSLGCQKNKITI